MADKQSKIFDRDFRNELYKNLLEIGYTKNEATNIVSVKYLAALKSTLISKLLAQIESVKSDSTEIVLAVAEYHDLLTDIRKAEEILNKKTSANTEEGKKSE